MPVLLQLPSRLSSTMANYPQQAFSGSRQRYPGASWLPAQAYLPSRQGYAWAFRGAVKAMMSAAYAEKGRLM